MAKRWVLITCVLGRIDIYLRHTEEEVREIYDGTPEVKYPGDTVIMAKIIAQKTPEGAV